MKFSSSGPPKKLLRFETVSEAMRRDHVAWPALDLLFVFPLLISSPPAFQRAAYPAAGVPSSFRWPTVHSSPRVTRSR